MRCAGLWLACGLVLQGCPIGLGDPLGFVDATAAVGARDAGDAAPASDARVSALDAALDAAVSDARTIDGAVDAGGPDAAAADADPPDLGPLDVGVEPTEPCTNVVDLGCTPLGRFTAGSPVRGLRVAQLANRDALVAVVTDTALSVLRFDDGVVSVRHTEALPSGSRPVGVALASDGSRWIAYVTTDREVLCRAAEVSGTTVPVGRAWSQAGVGAIDAEVSYGMHAVAVDPSTAAPALLYWSGDDCATLATPDRISIAAHPLDAAFVTDDRDNPRRAATVHTTTVAGAAQLRVTITGAMGGLGLTWTVPGRLAGASIDAVVAGGGVVAALATRTATAPQHTLLEVLQQPGADPIVRGQTRVVRGNTAVADCGGMCTAIVFVPRIAPDRVELLFVQDALGPRGSGYARAACAPGEVSAVDVSSTGGNDVSVAWTSASTVAAAHCPRL